MWRDSSRRRRSPGQKLPSRLQRDGLHQLPPGRGDGDIHQTAVHLVVAAAHQPLVLQGSHHLAQLRVGHLQAAGQLGHGENLLRVAAEGEQHVEGAGAQL